jgi:hypothetical protein
MLNRKILLAQEKLLTDPCAHDTGIHATSGD